MLAQAWPIGVGDADCHKGVLWKGDEGAWVTKNARDAPALPGRPRSQAPLPLDERGAFYLTEAAVIICVTPVRNEAWILERFLGCASVWADHILVADQGSTDGSRAIVGRFPKAVLIENDSPVYDEGARQALLLREARRFPGPRLIVALDADEALAADALERTQWRELTRSPPGTVGLFPWVNLLPGAHAAWVPPEPIAFAFMDDGTAHTGSPIHSTRVPVPAGAPRRIMDDVPVLHFQHVHWRRMKSKQRWYQCWELLNERGKRPVQIYRQYHRMDAFPRAQIVPVQPRWLNAYVHMGTDPCAADDTLAPPWDAEVAGWIAEHGRQTFRRLDIWDDWEDVAHSAGGAPPGTLGDPRSRLERTIHRWLRRTQPRAHARSVRMVQKLLIPMGW